MILLILYLPFEDILSFLSLLHTVFAVAHSLLQPRLQPRVCQRQWKQGSAQTLKFKPVHVKQIGFIPVDYTAFTFVFPQISEMSVTTLRESTSISAFNTITPSSTCPSLVEGYGNTELRSVLRLHPHYYVFYLNCVRFAMFRHFRAPKNGDVWKHCSPRFNSGVAF